MAGGAVLGTAAGLLAADILYGISRDPPPPKVDPALLKDNNLSGSEQPDPKGQNLVNSPFPKPSRAEYEQWLRTYFGQLEGTPYAIRSPEGISPQRPRADPRSVLPSPLSGQHEQESSAWRPTTAERLVGPLDPARNSRPAIVSLPSYQVVNPNAVDPTNLTEVDSGGQPDPRPTAQGRSRSYRTSTAIWRE